MSLELHCPVRPHVVIEHLKCRWFELTSAISIKYTLNFEDIAQKMENISIMCTLFFEMIIFWHQNILKELPVHAASIFSSLLFLESSPIIIPTIQLSLSRSLITYKSPVPRFSSQRASYLPAQSTCQWIILLFPWLSGQIALLVSFCALNCSPPCPWLVPFDSQHLHVGIVQGSIFRVLLQCMYIYPCPWSPGKTTWNTPIVEQIGFIICCSRKNPHRGGLWGVLVRWC